MLTYEATDDFNVLGSLMKNRIVCNFFKALVLSALSGVGPRIRKPRLWRSYRSQITSLLIEDIDMYSASAEDFETVVIFLHFQEIRGVPRNTYTSKWSGKPYSVKASSLVCIYIASASQRGSRRVKKTLIKGTMNKRIIFWTIVRGGLWGFLKLADNLYSMWYIRTCHGEIYQTANKPSR